MFHPPLSIAPSMITLKYIINRRCGQWTVVVVVDTASIVMAWVVVTTTRSFTVGCAVFGRRRLSSGSVDDLISLSLCTSFREFVAAATSFLLPSMTAASYESHISSIATSRVVSNGSSLLFPGTGTNRLPCPTIVITYCQIVATRKQSIHDRQ